MSAGNSRASLKLRLQLAHTAAKFVAVEGINDFQLAKKKAALQLGVSPGKNMPANSEIEEALLDYQKLFQTVQQPQNLRTMREHAIKAMRFLEPLKPRLVGPVLSGTATEYSDITLHVFTDEPEQVGFFLDENGIPYSCCEKTIRVNARQTINLPACRFLVDDNTIMLVVFSGKQINLVPLSSIDGKPMQRANIVRVEALANNLA